MNVLIIVLQYVFFNTGRLLRIISVRGMLYAVLADVILIPLLFALCVAGFIFCVILTILSDILI